jgi:hypothetical protein
MFLVCSLLSTSLTQPITTCRFVEQWDDGDRHVEELIALVGDYATARSAYEEAVKRKARQAHHASAEGAGY